MFLGRWVIIIYWSIFMELVTHFSAGALCGYWLQTKFPKAKVTIYLSIAAALAPDLDVLFMGSKMTDYLTSHRGLTHSFIVTIPIAILVAFIYRIFRKKLNFIHVFMIWMLNSYIHIYLDYSNNYGTKIWYPLSEKVYFFDSMYVIDFLYTLPIVIISLVLYRSKTVRNYLATIGMIWVLLYPFSNFLIRNTLEYKLFQRAQIIDSRIKAINVIPDMFAPFCWKVILETENSYVFRGYCFFSPDFWNVKKEFKKADMSIFEKYGKQSRLVEVVGEFVRYPVMERLNLKTGYKLLIGDLRLYTIFFDHFKKNSVAPYSFFLNFDNKGNFLSYRMIPPMKALMTEKEF